MAKTKEVYDAMKDPKSVYFVQPDEIVEPMVQNEDGAVTVLDPMPMKEVPSGNQ